MLLSSIISMVGSTDASIAGISLNKNKNNAKEEKITLNLALFDY